MSCIYVCVCELYKFNKTSRPHCAAAKHEIFFCCTHEKTKTIQRHIYSQSLCMCVCVNITHMARSLALLLSLLLLLLLLPLPTRRRRHLCHLQCFCFVWPRSALFTLALSLSHTHTVCCLSLSHTYTNTLCCCSLPKGLFLLLYTRRRRFVGLGLWRCCCFWFSSAFLSVVLRRVANICLIFCLLLSLTTNYHSLLYALLYTVSVCNNSVCVCVWWQIPLVS